VDTDSNGIADRLEIVDLLNRYAVAIDDKDWEALSEVFCDDCTADYGQFGTFNGVDAVVAWMAPTHADLTTQHAMANMVIAIDQDTATARSYVHVFLRPDQSPSFRVGGAYRDELRRVDGRWKIANRVYTTIWQQN
jgi:3-phenylpropionate/cinnamic acid dioxygenase small subunit